MARFTILCLVLALATVALSYPSAPQQAQAAEPKETLQAENSFGLGYGLYGGGLGGLGLGGLGYGGLGYGGFGGLHGGLGGLGLGLGLYGR